MAICCRFSKPSLSSAVLAPSLAGRDVIGIASTGSGKTMAFLVPALLKIATTSGLGQRGSGPRMLIMAPTASLLAQSDVVYEVGEFKKGNPVRSICIYGGIQARTEASSKRWGRDCGYSRTSTRSC